MRKKKQQQKMRIYSQSVYYHSDSASWKTIAIERIHPLDGAAEQLLLFQVVVVYKHYDWRNVPNPR